MHEAVWGERLACPAGGNYVWNPKWRTMESTVLGHPGEPKPGPDAMAPLRDVKSADFGITFQDGGLRRGRDRTAIEALTAAVTFDTN